MLVLLNADRLRHSQALVVVPTNIRIRIMTIMRIIKILVMPMKMIRMTSMLSTRQCGS